MRRICRERRVPYRSCTVHDLGMEFAIQVSDSLRPVKREIPYSVTALSKYVTSHRVAHLCP